MNDQQYKKSCVNIHSIVYEIVKELWVNNHYYLQFMESMKVACIWFIIIVIGTRFIICSSIVSFVFIVNVFILWIRLDDHGYSIPYDVNSSLHMIYHFQTHHNYCDFICWSNIIGSLCFFTRSRLMCVFRWMNMYNCIYALLSKTQNIRTNAFFKNQNELMTID